jgi:hypothetical protein
MDPLQIEAVEDYKRLIEQGKSEDEALAHAFQRFGVLPADILKALDPKGYDDV